jgi:hypothetical protein
MLSGILADPLLNYFDSFFSLYLSKKKANIVSKIVNNLFLQIIINFVTLSRLFC